MVAHCFVEVFVRLMAVHMDWVLIVEVTATAHKGWRLEEDLGKRFAVEVEQYLAVWVVPLMAVRLQLGHIYSEQSGHEMEEQ